MHWRSTLLPFGKLTLRGLVLAVAGGGALAGQGLVVAPPGLAGGYQLGGQVGGGAEAGGVAAVPGHALAGAGEELEVVRLAYNLVTAFQRTCLPEDWQSLTLSKLRQRLLWLPGELTRPQNRPILRLVNSPLIAQKAEKILRRVHRLKPLES